MYYAICRIIQFWKMREDREYLKLCLAWAALLFMMTGASILFMIIMSFWFGIGFLVVWSIVVEIAMKNTE